MRASGEHEVDGGGDPVTVYWPRALRAATWNNTWHAHTRGIYGGDERGGDEHDISTTHHHEAAQPRGTSHAAHTHAPVLRRMRRVGGFWVEMRGTPARPAAQAHELDEDEPLSQQELERDDLPRCKNSAQHAHAAAARAEAVKARQGSRSTAHEGRAGMAVEEGAGGSAGSSVLTMGAVQQREEGGEAATARRGHQLFPSSSQSCDHSVPSETIFSHEMPRGTTRRILYGATSTIGGTLRATREAASAAVRSARRFFFRDTG